ICPGRPPAPAGCGPVGVCWVIEGRLRQSERRDGAHGGSVSARARKFPRRLSVPARSVQHRTRGGPTSTLQARCPAPGGGAAGPSADQEADEVVGPPPLLHLGGDRPPP